MKIVMIHGQGRKGVTYTMSHCVLEYLRDDIVINRIKCVHCGEILVSNNRHDFKFCSCKGLLATIAFL